MIFYRRNTFSDKVISFICMMLAVVTLYNEYIIYQIQGKIMWQDILVALISLGLGVLFLCTAKFKYLEFGKDSVTWYTWFFVKHTLTKDQIKEIGTKKRYIILVKENKGQVWISNLYVRNGEDEKVRELFKNLQSGSEI